jgi:hypothetical protein
MEASGIPCVKETFSGKAACTWYPTKNKVGYRRVQNDVAAKHGRRFWSAFVPEGQIPDDYLEFQV